MCYDTLCGYPLAISGVLYEEVDSVRHSWTWLFSSVFWRLQKLRKVKQETAEREKPDVVKTHLRNMLIIPEMVGSMVGVYNGKVNVIRTICIFSFLYYLKYGA